MLQVSSFTWRALTLVVICTPLLLLHARMASADSPTSSASASHDLDLRLETTTYVLNLEKQGLEDNTFTNGLGRDTTLIGNLLNVYVRKRLFASMDLDLGLFANMPFGHDTEVSQVGRDEAEDGEVFGQGCGGVDEYVLARFDVALVERAVFLI